jgi:hypothetical protein
MKFIFVLFLFLLQNEINAQSLIDTSKSWTVDECTVQWGLACIPFTYAFQGDTIINSTTYHILQPGNHFLREDSLSKKVFDLQAGAGQEMLLYDFDLNKGDTFLLNCSSVNQPMIVDSVDTFQYNGIWRKRIMFDWQSGLFGTIWIEGIGGTCGIVHNFSTICMIDGGAFLTCADSSGTQIYQNPYFPGCNVVLDIEDNSLKNSCTIFPNPFQDKIIIDFQQKKELKFQLHNSFGQKVFETILVSERNEVNLAFLATGIYYAVFSAENEILVQKILKTE